ncbi:MBL fold metallo-hydrolase [Comamonas terrae]|uniref:MBL fold metallo-hydrolase n=1 Tax=Comamonas terrae TaxID=673548 RepID=A0ABW5UQ79_9BURK|nr:MBL fold metallo-hydrolase [Comamonas terrae]
MTDTASASSSPRIQAFFDEATFTVTYLVSDPGSGEAAVIDPVLDYDHRSGRVSTASADRVLQAIAEQGLALRWILETHAHADHLSAAPYLKARTGAPVAIGEHIREVQAIFAPVFHALDVAGDGREFDRLLRDGEALALGALQIQVLHTPGHTPACVSYRVGDAVFVGDTLFMPDYGTARADFPGGSARQLYRSIRRLLALPPATRLFLCHDYLAPGREAYAWETTVAAQRAHNVHVHEGVDEDAFVALREKRDATLAAPALLLPSVQVNMRAGRLPPAEADGVSYLRIPVRLPPGMVKI